MEVKDYICIELEHLKRVTSRVLDGLSQSEMAWRPGAGCNPIGLILFHIMKFEDSVIQSRIQGQQTLWESEKWYERLKLPESESGARYTEEQVAAFPVPEPSELVAYHDAVRARTIEYVKSLNANDFDKIINMQPFGDISIGSLLALVLGHQSQHMGEISYLRGLQRGMNK